MSRIFPLTLIRTAGLPFATLNFEQTDWSAFESDCASAELKQRQCLAALTYIWSETLAALPEGPVRTAVYNARRKFKRLVKTGLEVPLGIDAGFKGAPGTKSLENSIQDWNAVLEETREAATRLENARQANLQAQYRSLQKLAADETLQRALLFAARDLLQRLPAFRAKKTADFTKKDRRIAQALWQYAARAAYKTSPLSRFTTVSLHRLDKPDADRNTLSAGAKIAVTPNVALLPALYEALLREPAFYRNVGLRLNPSLTQNNGLQWLYFDGEHESFQEAENNPMLGLVVACFRAPSIKLVFKDLINNLRKSVDSNESDLEKYVLELIDIGLLERVLPEAGLTPGWCGALYNILGFLPAAPALTACAELLQWLRNAGRTLQFQPLEQALATQQEALERTRLFLISNGVPMPPIPAEQIFFEDVEQSFDIEVESGVVENLLAQLGGYWQNLPAVALSKRRNTLHAFAKIQYAGCARIDFLSFSRAFLEAEAAGTLPAAPLKTRSVPRPGKIGAQFQLFRRADGRIGAVLNGLFPGGGRLMARWMHLFPPYAQEALFRWQEDLRPYPWQGWHNANFQPGGAETVAVPDSRFSGASIPLNALDVRLDGESLQLAERDGGRPVVFADLGLEALNSRPPAMQLLWLLGVPAVSKEALISPEMRQWRAGGAAWRSRPRIERGDWVFQRAAWLLEPGLFAPLRTRADFFTAIRRVFQDIGIPKHFFARPDIPGEKPQFFDLDSPISVLLLEKMLGSSEVGVAVTEALPGIGTHLGGGRAQEWVGEFVCAENSDRIPNAFA
jgi:Lantibiotic dehydratase, N terminus